MILKITDLKISFEETNILNPTNISFFSGEINTIIGTSGIGKTSFLNAIGMLNDQSKNANFTIDDHTLLAKKESDRARNRKKFFSYISQQDTLINHLSVKENIEINYRFKLGKNLPTDKLYDTLLEFNIAYLIDRKVSSLSGGERQRVALVRAILVDSDIILCDEPTSGLDDMNKDAVIKIIQKIVYEKNKIVIIVTHDKDLAQIGDNRYEIKNKSLVTLKETSKPHKETISSIEKSPSNKNFYNWYSKINKKNNALPKFVLAIFSIAVVFSTLFNNFGQEYINNQKKSIQNSWDKKIFTQKTSITERNYKLGLEPFTQNEINSLNQENITSVQPYYEFSQKDTIPYSNENNNTGDKNSSEISMSPYIETTKEKTIFSFNDSNYFVIVPYDEKDFPELEIKENTVLFSKFFDNTVINTKEAFDLTLYIPFALAKMKGTSSNGQIYMQTSSLEKVKDLIFGGYVDYSKINIPSSMPQRSIYMHKNLMNKLLQANIEKNKDFNTSEFKYQNELLGHEFIDHKNSAYILDVSDVSEIDSVISKYQTILPALSFFSWGKNLEASVKSFENLQDIIKIISFCLIFLVTLLFGTIFYFKTLKRRKEIGILKLFGLSKKDIRKLFILDISKDIMKIYTYSVTLTIIFGIIMNKILMDSQLFKVDLSTFYLPLIVISFSLLIATPLAIIKVLNISPDEILKENR